MAEINFPSHSSTPYKPFPKLPPDIAKAGKYDFNRFQTNERVGELITKMTIPVSFQVRTVAILVIQSRY